MVVPAARVSSGSFWNSSGSSKRLDSKPAIERRTRLTPYPALPVASIKDPHGAEIRALARLFDFSGKRVLEVGSGEGRLTRRYAGATQSVLAIEPDAEAVALAQAGIPPDLAERVSFRMLDATELEEPPGSFDAAFLSWSL
jgi:2-polyprenyl-3-methyl-5-hydroxy-6-metoxy-1,4-benzoquinol methylase